MATYPAEQVNYATIPEVVDVALQDKIPAAPNKVTVLSLDFNDVQAVQAVALDA